VVDVKARRLLDHSPDYLFKHCINARFIPGSKCEKFLGYVETITAGDEELKLLLRVTLGYLFSHYNNAKVAFLIYGIPHTGKSVLCNVISRIIGEEHIANIDFGMLHKQEYAASLSGKLLNVAPDLRNEPIKEVGFFKSLVSHDDVISSRSLYENPRKIKCETKMLFSTNHLLSFHADIGIYDIEAVFNRLIYFPFQNTPITAQEDNKHLSDEIYAERDAIFTWAMGGLKYYVENNETFPECKLSEEIKARNIAQYCPEKIFVCQCLKRVDGRYESSSEIKKAFDQFCLEIGSKMKGNIADYLEEHEHLPKIKKRINADGLTTSEGNPIYVYEGIRLKKKYRSHESEE
jgi:putative DNA primase/helicase